MNDNLQTLQHAQATAIDLALRFGPKLVVALLILAAGHFIGRWAGRAADAMLIKLDLDAGLKLLLTRIVRMLEAFRARGIAIPFPQREVRLLGAA